jgi:ribosomal protein RSM22 (predicted rRNA methylase)
MNEMGAERILALPDDLREAVEQALAGVPATRWMRAAQELSERYRGPRDTPATLARGPDQALGYAALILPATFAQLAGAIAAVAARAAGWAPRTLLDLGSGPGTALWAAAAQWPALGTMAAWEREAAFIALGRQLGRGSQCAALREAHWRQVELGTLRVDQEQGDKRISRQGNKRTHITGYDLVILGHVLNELEPAAQAAVLSAAWDLTDGVLLVVEPGTPAGFVVVRAARDALLAQGAYTIAPCAHDRPCPLQDDWCHFPRRLWRPEFQRRARGAPSQWEEAKFSYAAMARFPPESPVWGRVIREPAFNKAYAEVIISSREGVRHYRALKRHREAFRQIKNLPWGAALEQPPDDPIVPVTARSSTDDRR